MSSIIGLHRRSNTTNPTLIIPKPYVFKPTEKWEETDGKWSSFYLNVGADDKGNGGQNFRVMISTSSGLTLLPYQADWCNSATCAASRGLEVLNSKQPLGFEARSVEYTDHGIFGIPDPYGWPGSQFNESGKPNATSGFAMVGLGQSSPQSPMMPAQIVAATPSKEYFIGSFGLGVGTIATSGSTTHPFLYGFEYNNQTPSLSYGFTAGAHYRNGGRGARANLVLGGYDITRFIGSSEYPSIPITESNLIVNVQSVQYSPSPEVRPGSTSFTAETDTSMFFAAIDSTFSYLWLPKKVCDHFADTFQLNYDERRNFYSVNDTAHKYNLQQNGTVSFVLSKDRSSTQRTTTIHLPYEAFSQPINQILFPNTNATRLFPIKRSTNDKYVLGRTFLQEAYVIVDYDNSNFTVAQAAWMDPMPPETIVPIISTKWVLPTNGTSQGSDGLSGGAIAGIVVGILSVLGIAGLIAFFYWKRRRVQQHNPESTERVSEIDTTQAGEQFKYRRVSELSSEQPGSPKPAHGGYHESEAKDTAPFPTINEMESPPAELYSPPPENATPALTDGRTDYFIAGNKVRRRGATRGSSGNNTTGTPTIAELPGDDGKFMVDGQHFEPVASPISSTTHSRGPSDASLQTNIDEVIAGNAAKTDRHPSPSPARASTPGVSPGTFIGNRKPREFSPGVSPEPPQGVERRPSHTRGLSDITVHSDDTAVSSPTPEEVESWSKKDNEKSRKPRSD